MKLIKIITIAVAYLLHFNAHAQTSELKVFLEKFEIYSKTHSPKIKRAMPIIKPENDARSMPQAHVEGYMEDRETGLRYYSQLNKIYDPSTGYYIEYDPEANYHVDTKAGKIYKAKSEVKVQREEAK